jgi:Ca-activated chloride channel family protein
MLRALSHIIPILSLLGASLGGGELVFAQTKPQKPSGRISEEQASMKINTDLVTLSVSVNDKKGRPIANLRKESFEIFEDGKLQTIEFFGQEDQPISFGLLLDRSQSMNESAKIENAKAVAISFLRAGNPQNEAFCLAFNETPSLVADYTSDYAKVESVLAGIQIEGGTALYDAIIEGLGKLARAKHRRRALVVITDGRDQHSKHSLADLVKRAQQSDAQIYTVGFFSPVESESYKDEGQTVKLADGKEVDNPRFVFKTLAVETGAETYFPKSAKELAETVAQIAASLRRQYTLAYYPTNQNSDDGYRRITVKVKGDHGEIKTRQGYRLSESPVSAAAETVGDQPASRQTSTVVITPPKGIQPVEGLAPPILQENFDNLSGSLVKWPQSGKCSVSKGKLYVAEECVVPVGAFIYNDFEASVTATFIIRPQRSTSGGSDSGSVSSPTSISLPTIGVSFRINENGYYTLLISPATVGGGGYYKLIKVDGGKQTEITSWRRDMAIAIRNQIKLRCAESKLEIYVNNLRLDTLKDGSHKRGSISLVFSGEAGMFDDLAIKRLN